MHNLLPPLRLCVLHVCSEAAVKTLAVEEIIPRPDSAQRLPTPKGTGSLGRWGWLMATMPPFLPRAPLWCRQWALQALGEYKCSTRACVSPIALITQQRWAVPFILCFLDAQLTISHLLSVSLIHSSEAIYVTDFYDKLTVTIQFHLELNKQILYLWFFCSSK